MEVIGFVLAALVVLFFLAVVSFIVFVAVQVIKGYRRVRAGRDSFNRRISNDWDRKSPRSYK